MAGQPHSYPLVQGVSSSDLVQGEGGAATLVPLGPGKELCGHIFPYPPPLILRLFPHTDRPAPSFLPPAFSLTASSSLRLLFLAHVIPRNTVSVHTCCTFV